MQSPRCKKHDSVMTFGRYSKSEKYSDAQCQVDGKWFSCYACVERIDAISKLKLLIKEYRRGINEAGHWERFHQIARENNISRSVQADIVQGH